MRFRLGRLGTDLSVRPDASAGDCAPLALRQRVLGLLGLGVVLRRCFLANLSPDCRLRTPLSGRADALDADSRGLWQAGSAQGAQEGLATMLIVRDNGFGSRLGAWWNVGGGGTAGSGSAISWWNHGHSGSNWQSQLHAVSKIHEPSTQSAARNAIAL
jgi:hypothetical protein